MLTSEMGLRERPSFRQRHRHFAGQHSHAGPVDRVNHSRSFDSSTGRWIIPDPIGFRAGDTNEYRYVGNSPADGVDPKTWPSLW